MSEATTHSGTRPTRRFGLFYLHLDNDRDTAEQPERRTFDRQWHETLDHMRWAEEVGFDSIWLTERHMSGHVPSPLVLAAAIAAATTRVRIGTNLLVAPLYQPLRLAEEAAMVSVLSEGRFDLGVGQGHRAVDFANLGVEIRHRPSLLEETVQILRRAWTGEPFTFEGKRHRIPEPAAVRPIPATPPRILIGATSDAGMTRAARLGDGFLSAFNGHVRRFVQNVASTTGEEYTRPIFAAQQVIVAEDPQREWARVGSSALAHVNQNLSPEQRLQSPDEVLASKLIMLWDADTAVRKLRELFDRYPSVEDVHFMATAGPGEAVGATQERLQHLADVVLPQLRASS